MVLILTLVLFGLFLVFQCLYIFIPLFSTQRTSDQVSFSSKSVTILVPAFNEEKLISHCLDGILNSEAQAIEAIIINDGSTDKTMKILGEKLDLIQIERQKRVDFDHQPIRTIYHSKRYAHIFVIDKENGGKADALNAGIMYANHDVVVTLDADSILKSDAINKIQQVFKDECVIAAGGTVHVGQGMRKEKPHFSLSNLLRFQVLQYMTGFFLHKRAQSTLGAITVISGAFGAFRMSVLVKIGGYRSTVGEDMDITLKCQQYVKTIFKQGKLIYVPEAICYTECPESLQDLFRQRIRWQKAFVDCIITYRKSLFTKIRFLPSVYLLLDSFLLGTLNAFFMLIIPFMLLFSAINLIIPFSLLVISFTFACYQSIAVLIVSNRFHFNYRFVDYLRYMFFIPFEIFSYRLLGILFVTVGTILYFFNRDSWYVSKRLGRLKLEEAI